MKPMADPGSLGILYSPFPSALCHLDDCEHFKLKILKEKPPSPSAGLAPLAYTLILLC